LLAKGRSCVRRRAHACIPRVMTVPFWAGNAALAVTEHLAWQAVGAQADGNRDHLVPVAAYLAGWEALAVGRDHFGSDRLPLRSQRGAVHRLPDLEGGGLQRIQRGLCGQSSGADPGHVDNRRIGSYIARALEGNVKIAWPERRGNGGPV
jgi:hypothetical protein